MNSGGGKRDISLNKPNANLQKFDWRELGMTTSVKNQGWTNLCWSYSTIAAIEQNLLIKKLAKHRDLLDLDEHSFAYHARNRNPGADLLGNTDADLKVSLNLAEWTSRYSTKEASYSLLQWNSIANQATHYSDYKHSFQFKTTDVVWLNANDKQAIKEAVVKYGGVVFDYDEIRNTNSRYFNNPLGSNRWRAENMRHAATIVGWNDEIAVENFNPENRPNEKGAFLVKNSWGAHRDGGYFWLSYETSIYNAFSVNLENGEKYDFNYYYDGLSWDNESFLEYGNKAAVLFRAMKGNEKSVEVLKAINVGLKRAKGEKLKIKVYRDLDYDFSTLKPRENAIYEHTYDIDNDGSRSFEIGNNGVELAKNKSFAIEVEVIGGKGEIIFSREMSSSNDFSFYWDGNTWKNSLVYHKSSARIKAWTKLESRTNRQSSEHVSIDSKDLRYADISFKNHSYRWGEAPGKPIIQHNGAFLVEGRDYTLTFEDKFHDKGKDYYSDEAVLNGNGLVTIKGMGQYSNQVELPYFYKIASGPNLEVFHGKFDSYGKFNSSLGKTLDSSKWQVVSDGSYFNYIAEDKNHYRNTSFSAEQIKEIIGRLNLHSTSSSTFVSQPNYSQPNYSQPQHSYQNYQINQDNSQISNEENITQQTIITVEQPQNTNQSNSAISTIIGGASGGFTLMTILFSIIKRKFF